MHEVDAPLSFLIVFLSHPKLKLEGIFQERITGIEAGEYKNRWRIFTELDVLHRLGALLSSAAAL